MPSTILSDNGVTSGTAGIKTTGSNDGQLALQTTTAGGTATTALTIDTSQRVGIGTASPASTLDVSGTTKTTGNTTLVSDGTAAYLNVGDASPPAGVNTLQHIFNGYGVLAGQKVNNGEFDIGYNFYYQSGFKSRVDGIAYRLSMGEVSGQIDLQIAPAPGGAGSALTFTKVLLAQKDKSIALQGATPQTGTGITFPATQSSSSNANTLDDYEEGTFTYTINAGGSNLNSGGGTFTGYYTKIGNLVTLQGSNQIITKSAATGDITITGLPFAPSGAQASVLLSALQEIGFADYPSARIETGATTINLFETTNAGTRTTLTNADWLNNGFMNWSTSYRV